MDLTSLGLLRRVALIFIGVLLTALFDAFDYNVGALHDTLLDARDALADTRDRIIDTICSYIGLAIAIVFYGGGFVVACVLAAFFYPARYAYRLTLSGVDSMIDVLLDSIDYLKSALV